MINCSHKECEYLRCTWAQVLNEEKCSVTVVINESEGQEKEVTFAQCHDRLLRNEQAIASDAQYD